MSKRATLLALGLTLSTAAAAHGAAPPPPSASTQGAASITYQGAVLTATVNPHGTSTSYYFQYGNSIAYGGVTALGVAGSGSSGVSAATSVGGLAPATTYHYRVVAVSTAGTAVGADRTFKTLKVPLSLAIAAVPSTTPYGDPALIEGTLSGTGNGNREVILQANPFPYTAGFQNIGNPELTTANGSFSFAVLSVTLNTQYRVVGASSPTVVSPTVFEYAAVVASEHVSRHKLRRGTRLRFSGRITPAQSGAQVGLQRLTAKGWRVVAGGISAADSTYAVSIRTTHGGFFRIVVTPANQGAYVTGYSQAALVHLHG
jgi:hypothetical protein